MVMFKVQKYIIFNILIYKISLEKEVRTIFRPVKVDKVQEERREQLRIKYVEEQNLLISLANRHAILDIDFENQ